MKKFELVATTQKSYYGKAHVEVVNGKALLYSYNTLVCYIDEKTTEFVRVWDAWSATTSRHVDDFRKLYNLGKLGKKAWCSLPAVAYNPLMDVVKDAYTTFNTPYIVKTSYSETA